MKTIYKRIPRGNLSLKEAWELEPTTTEEIIEAQNLFKSNKFCSHLYVTFDPGWLYDSCDCAICKKFIAFV